MCPQSLIVSPSGRSHSQPFPNCIRPVVPSGQSGCRRQCQPDALSRSERARKPGAHCGAGGRHATTAYPPFVSAGASSVCGAQSEGLRSGPDSQRGSAACERTGRSKRQHSSKTDSSFGGRHLPLGSSRSSIALIPMLLVGANAPLPFGTFLFPFTRSSSVRTCRPPFASRALPHAVLRDEAVHALEGAVQDFDLRAFVVAADDSHRGVVVDLFGGQSFAEASDHSADAALLFQVCQFREGIFVRIDGNGAFAVVRDQLVTASRDRQQSPD